MSQSRLIALLPAAVAVVVCFFFLYALLKNLGPADTAVPNPSTPRQNQTVTTPAAESEIRLTSMTEHAGVDMVYYGSPSAERYMTDQLGGGAALFDYDGDGRLDLFLVNGSHFQQPAEHVDATNRLYRGDGSFRFEDVTLPTGLRAYGFGMGCSAADYNNDGFTDLFVAYFGKNRLWQNNGDGTFDEVTDSAGLGETRWSTSAAFADLDGDGNLDLYVVNYVDWREDKQNCFKLDRPPYPVVCDAPSFYNGQADSLYRNLGDGRFQEMGEAAGIAVRDEGKGLAVAVADWDGDHRLDIYVANDTTRNFLFHNRGNLQFEEVGYVEGVALCEDGQAGGSMGIAVGDFNRDLRFDLFVTNFSDQSNDVFLNLGERGFIASSAQLGMERASRADLAFGIALADFDRDGYQDLFVANGHIRDRTTYDPPEPYDMLPRLMQNRSGQSFADVGATAGQYFQKRWLGRAAALGDLDNDGDTDLVVTHLKQPPAILRNDCIAAGGSIQLEIIGTRSARQMLGARIELLLGDERIVAYVPSGGSFQSSHDHRVLVSTGSHRVVAEVLVHWADGVTETWRNLSTGQQHQLVEGSRRPIR